MWTWFSLYWSRDNRIKGQETASFPLLIRACYVCTNIISWASTHSTVINGFWFESQYVSHGTACWVSCSIVVPVYIFLFKYYTLKIQVYITKEHHFPIFVTFEITRNNKCTMHSFQEKYQLVCSSILSYILTYHFFSNISIVLTTTGQFYLKIALKLYWVWYKPICSGKISFWSWFETF